MGGIVPYYDDQEAEKVCNIFNVVSYIFKGDVKLEGKEDLLELAEYVDKLQEENKQLKQFKEKIFTSIEKEIARNEKTIEWKKETLDLLNELHDENEQLKQQNEFLKKRCDEYWKELRLNNDYLNEE